MLSAFKVDQRVLEGLSERERAHVLEELKVLEEAFKENPLLGYQPHSKQRLFHQAGESGKWPRTRLFIGGNRSGKTVATHVDSIVQCVDSDVVPEHLLPFKRWVPPCYVRIVGPDLTRWLDGVAMQKMREWCPKGQLAGGTWARAWEKQQLMLRFKNGSWVQFMSNDQDLEKFAGAALHRVVFDESPRQDIRAECRMRLIDYGGEELFGLTPTEGMSNWLYEEFFAVWERGELDGERARLVLVDMDDNPHLSDEDKTWALAGLAAEEREARKTGRFVSFQGLIYPEFKHVVPQPDEVPFGAEVFCGVDPGYRHLCVVLWCWLDEDDDLVVFDELAVGRSTIQSVCGEIELRNEKWGVRPNWYVIDPAARNRNAQTGRSDQQEFADHGIFTVPGQNARRPGINRVKERLEADRLHVSAGCRELISEFRKYRWTPVSSRSENAAREEPVKRDDHALDALRYVVMSRPLAPKLRPGRPEEGMMRRLLKSHVGRVRRPLPDSGYGPGQWS